MSARAPRLLVAGSIALDSLTGLYGEIEDELGGSALYFALAAALARPAAAVEVHAPVGPDAEARVDELLAGRPIAGAGVVRVAAPTYRWRAAAAANGNRDLGSRDSIYDAWRPAIPPGFDGWLFVGSMRTDRQREAAAGGCDATLVAVDAMRSYIGSRPDRFQEVLGLAGWYFATDDELAALGGAEPEAFRRRHRLRGLVIKHGPGGVTAWTDAGWTRVRPPIGLRVVDTTGAGDALAGAFLGAWSLSAGEPSALPEALRLGVAAASLAIEDVGLRRLRSATRRDLLERLSGVPEAISGTGRLR